MLDFENIIILAVIFAFQAQKIHNENVAVTKTRKEDYQHGQLIANFGKRKKNGNEIFL